MAKKTRISDLAEVATCQRRVYLKAKYGQKETNAQTMAKKRGIVLHEKAYQQKRPDSKSQDKRCYIATSIYGIDANETQTLRDFRDNTMMKTSVGRCLISMYYNISPHIVKLSNGKPWMITVSRLILNKFVRRLER